MLRLDSPRTQRAAARRDVAVVRAAICARRNSSDRRYEPMGFVIVSRPALLYLPVGPFFEVRNDAAWVRSGQCLTWMMWTKSFNEALGCR